MKNMNNEEKIKLIISFYNQELSKRQKQKFLQLIHNDTEFAELLKKGKEIKGFMNVLENDISLKHSEDIINLPQEDRQHLTVLFKRLDREAEHNKSLKVYKRRRIYLNTRMALIAAGVAGLFIFTFFYFSGQIRYRDNENNLFVLQQDKHPKNNEKENKTTVSPPEIDERDNQTDTFTNNIQPEVVKEVVPQKEELLATINPDEYPRNPNMEKLIEGHFKSAVKGFEMKVTKVGLDVESPTNLLFTFDYETDSLSKTYALEIEDFDKEEVYQKKIESKEDVLPINVSEWKDGYYYWKLKLRGKKPMAGRFLKVKNQLLEIKYSY